MKINVKGIPKGKDCDDYLGHHCRFLLTLLDKKKKVTDKCWLFEKKIFNELKCSACLKASKEVK